MIFMARPSVTCNDVTKAALERAGEGKLPTIDNIRQKLLGTGSSSTIAPYLRAWRAKQGETQLIASKEKLPEDLVALVKGLWEHELQEAETQINTIEQNANKNLNEHKQQIKNLAQEIKCLQQQRNQLLQKEQQLTNDKLTLEQAIIQLQNEQITLQIELQRLNQQVQNNLDHYREASREQRLKEQQQYENQIKYLEQSSQQYLQENSYLKKQGQLSQEKRDQLQNDDQILENEHQIMATQLHDVVSQLIVAKESLAASLNSETHWQVQYQNLSNKLEGQEQIVSGLQRQVALLPGTENQLNEMSQQNKLLAHEKWQLGQEAVQLMGQLKKINSVSIRNN